MSLLGFRNSKHGKSNCTKTNNNYALKGKKEEKTSAIDTVYCTLIYLTDSETSMVIQRVITEYFADGPGRNAIERVKSLSQI